MNQSVTPLNSVSQFSPFSNHRINYLKQSISREKNNILTWSCFALFVIYLFHFQSDGDFSFLLVACISRVLGRHWVQLSNPLVLSLCYIKSQALTLLKVTDSIMWILGISLKSLILYLVVSSTRLLAVLLSDAYLPYDRSGDWLYRCTEGIGTVAIVALLLSIRKYRYTYYSFIVYFPISYKWGLVCRNWFQKVVEMDYSSSCSLNHICWSNTYDLFRIDSSFTLVFRNITQLMSFGAFLITLKRLPYIRNSYCLVEVE